MPAYRCNSETAHWIGPATLSLAAHGAGIALGVRLMTGGLDGMYPAPPAQPVTLHVAASSFAPSPGETSPTIPEIPAPPTPGPAMTVPESPAVLPQPPVEKPPPEPHRPARDEPPQPPAPEKLTAQSEPVAESLPTAAKAVSFQTVRPTSTQRAAGTARLCTPADYLHRTAIRYPDAARREGWEGRVMLDVALDAGGRPTSVSVVRSSGRAVLDETARRAVELWRFRPQRIAGITVPSHILVPVRFDLD